MNKLDKKTLPLVYKHTHINILLTHGAGLTADCWWTSSLETQTNCMLGCIFGEENKFLFSQMKTPLQVNICSVSAWFLSIIDLLMQNTQLFEKPECAIIMQRASGHLCVLVWPWQWSVPGLVPRWIPLSRAEERDTNTEPEGFSNAGFRVLLQQGCYQCWSSYRSSIPHCALNDGGKVLSHNERRKWWRLRVQGMLDRRWI